MHNRLIKILCGCAVACFLVTDVHSFKSRILGGRDPKHDEVKYLVAVQSVTALCGGGIIDDKFILTAAHCLRMERKSGKLARPAKIYAVLNNTRSYDEDTAITIDVVRAFVPKNMKLPFGDVAVLELEKSLDLKNNDRLQKLELPSIRCDEDTYPTYDNLDVKFAGFGHSQVEQKIDANGKMQNKTSSSGPLQIAKATVIDMNTCRTRYYGSMLTDSQLCIRIVEDEKLVTYQGVCTGDSGGPVVLDNKVVIGVASLGIECNTNSIPALFTRISSHIEFINNVVNGNLSEVTVISG